MSDFSPHPEGSAIAFASIKAAFTGTVFLIGVFLIDRLAGGDDFQINWLADIFVGIAVGTIIGSIFIGLVILVFGLPLAFSMKNWIASSWGIAIAFTCAVSVALVIGALFGNPLFGLILLPYALPAAYFYRSEILLEDSFR